jgi:hypothetical protein
MNDHDPKLKEAMEEIKVILRKYDVGASVTLVSPTHSEFLYELEPTWSCVRFTNDPKGQPALRFTATLERYGSAEKRQEAAELTTHMLLQIRDLGGKTFMTFEEVRKQLERFFKIDHKPFSKG